MKAMIFAAGLGTRLRPYTNDKPKAMVEVGGKTLIEWAIRRLLFCGFRDIVVNVHHFGQLLMDFLVSHNGFGANIIISDEREKLLNTGGGLKKAQQWLSNAPFLIYNVDVLSNLPLDELYRQHLNSEALATLVVRQRESSRYLLFDDHMNLSGWRNAKTGEEKIARPQSQYQAMAFSGIHILSPEIFDHMSSEDVFSIIDVYLTTAATECIKGFYDQHSIWLDVGKIPALEKAAQLLDQIQFY
jgi:NDP-sugar pyrophosphorylase family protein